MNKPIWIQASKLITNFVSVIILFSSANIYAANKTLSFKNQSDSLKTLVKKSKVDTIRFKILANFYWTYAKQDFNRVKLIGEWAYIEIKNSKNLKVLSDGLDIKGCILQNEKKYDSAYMFFLKALAISKKISYHSRTGWSYYHLGIINDALGHTDSAMFYLKTLVNFDIHVGFKTSACDVLYEIALIYDRQGQEDSTLLYFNKSLELSHKIQDKEREARITYIIAQVYHERNDTKNELINLNKALSMAESIHSSSGISHTYYAIGTLFYFQKKNYDIALNYFQKAFDNCASNNSEFKAEILNEMGKSYLKKGNDSQALLFTLKSLNISREIKFKHQISESYKNLGSIYIKQGKLEKAINSFKYCYNNGCDYCSKISFHSSLIDIADSYLKLNNQRKALKYYKESLKLADESNSRTEQAISNLKIGNYFRMINANNSGKYYTLAAQLAKQSKDIRVLKTIADTLSSFFKSSHDYKSAFEYQSLGKTLGDSINKIEQQESMASWELKFEFEKIKKDNEAKQAVSSAEVKRQKVYRNFLFAISSLFALLGTVVFFNYRRKKADNRLLTSQRDEIMKKNHEIEAQMDEIINQKDEIERISNRLHEADQAKLRFFANISHELRTPLTLIVSPLTKLLKGNVNGSASKLYSLMLRNSRRLQDLINQLLDISKIDKNELTLKLKLHDFNKQVRIIAAMFQSIADEKNIEFSITGMPGNLIFCFDAERVEQIVNNLLSNAFKFTPFHGKIEITITRENDTAILKVRDNGIGIPSESLDKVFDRFYQSDATITRHFEGSGIGLAITKELVELHNGTISVKSESGKWTEFTVILPMAHNESFTEVEEYQTIKLLDDRPSGKLSAAKKENSKNKETVLLVEDNNDLRSYVSDSLSEEYNVLEAINGTEGIEIAKKEIPDIIISDVMMPETDGYQLTSKVREHIETSHIPIILLTAKAGRESKIEGLQKGADDYIKKPFDEQELVLKIKNILQRRQRMQEKYRKQISVNPSDINAVSLDDQFLIKLTSSIEKYLSEPSLDVDFLSKEIGMSRQHMHKKLKALTDYSPNEFIRVIRLKRAAQLLKVKAGSVSEIAYETGFDNLSYFTKRFKEYFHVLPSDFQ